jgi:hypothetical protein
LGERGLADAVFGCFEFAELLVNSRFDAIFFDGCCAAFGLGGRASEVCRRGRDAGFGRCEFGARVAGEFELLLGRKFGGIFEAYSGVVLAKGRRGD